MKQCTENFQDLFVVYLWSHLSEAMKTLYDTLRILLAALQWLPLQDADRPRSLQKQRQQSIDSQILRQSLYLVYWIHPLVSAFSNAAFVRNLSWFWRASSTLFETMRSHAYSLSGLMFCSISVFFFRRRSAHSWNKKSARLTTSFSV